MEQQQQDIPPPPYHIGDVVSRDFGFLGPIEGTIMSYSDDSKCFRVKYRHTELDHTLTELMNDIIVVQSATPLAPPPTPTPTPHVPAEEVPDVAPIPNNNNNSTNNHHPPPDPPVVVAGTDVDVDNTTIIKEMSTENGSLTNTAGAQPPQYSVTESGIETKEEDTTNVAVATEEAAAAAISSKAIENDVEIPVQSPTIPSSTLPDSDTPEGGTPVVASLPASTSSPAAAVAAAAPVAPPSSSPAGTLTKKTNRKKSNQNSTNIILSHPTMLYTVGTIVRKEFNHLGTFYGIVTQLDIELKLYCVHYEDNELEEYSETELTTLVVKQKDIQEDYPYVSPAPTDTNQIQKKENEDTCVADIDGQQQQPQEVNQNAAMVLEGTDTKQRVERLKTLAVSLKTLSEDANTNKFVAVKSRKYPDGTMVRKKFPSGTYNGEIISYDIRAKYYRVRYEDNEEEEYREHELASILVLGDNVSVGSNESSLVMSDYKDDDFNEDDADDDDDDDDDAMDYDGSDEEYGPTSRKKLTKSKRSSTSRTSKRGKIFKQKYKIGVKVVKKFPKHGTFEGEIVRFSEKSGRYRLKYSDGDVEEMDLGELEKIIVKRSITSQQKNKKVLGKKGATPTKTKTATKGTKTTTKKNQKTATQKYKDGTIVEKFFEGHGIFQGTINSFNEKEGYYSVLYNDGDNEDISENEMENLMAASKSNTVGSKSDKAASKLEPEKVGGKKRRSSAGEKRKSVTPTKKRAKVVATPDTGDFVARKYKNGTIVEKAFEGFGIFEGTVRRFDKKEGLYRVVYTDGDFEDLTEEELERLIKNESNLSLAAKDAVSSSTDVAAGASQVATEVVSSSIEVVTGEETSLEVPVEATPNGTELQAPIKTESVNSVDAAADTNVQLTSGEGPSGGEADELTTMDTIEKDIVDATIDEIEEDVVKATIDIQTTSANQQPMDVDVNITSPIDPEVAPVTAPTDSTETLS